jgi:lycopene beta-cyclase
LDRISTPARRTRRTTSGHADRRPLVILGAGLAGLSLGCALLDAGVEREIVLIDRRREWTRDRTWCTWPGTRPTRFLELADHRWPNWRVAGPGGEVISRCPQLPYLHLRADTVYGHALERLDRAPQVTLLADERVERVQPGEPPCVVTTRRRLEAGEVFDGRGAAAMQPIGPADGHVTLYQRFLGWEVETDSPAFDPVTATLMEFRGSSPGDLRFLYVLPFSPHRALVEDTSFGVVAVPSAQRRLALEQDLAGRLGAERWRIRYEERGKVPMSTRRVSLHPGAHVHAIGTAGGAVRPSSGYAFSRIQAHCSAIADAVAGGRPLPARIGSRRRSGMDAIFLRALADRPEQFGDLFVRLAERTGPAAFARFMADASTPADEAQIVAGLLGRRFLLPAARAQVRAARHRWRPPGHRPPPVAGVGANKT